METNKIYQGHVLDVLKTFPNESVDCVITSPPYWGIRWYKTELQIFGGDEGCDHEWNLYRHTQHSGRKGTSKVGYHLLKENIPDDIVEANFCSKCNAWKGELGLEPSFKDYIVHLIAIFQEIKRVMKPTATCWVNLGDTYYGGGGGNQYSPSNTGILSQAFKKDKQYEEAGGFDYGYMRKAKETHIKSLCLIPFRFVIAMIDIGFILRNTIIWRKLNAMPSSVKDRFSTDFEYVFFFTKSKRYYFKRQKQPYKDASIKRANSFIKNNESFDERILEEDGANMRCVWDIPTARFGESHFATFPEELVTTPILAGCPEFVCKQCGLPKREVKKMESQSSFNIRVRDVKMQRLKSFDRIASEQEIEKYDEKHYAHKMTKYTISEGCECNAGFTEGIVLDPFMGAGTTALVALKLNRRFVGIELNPAYITMAYERIKPYLEQQKLTAESLINSNSNSNNNGM